MKIFLDCGFYAGNALQQYIDNGLVDESWTVYAFEPNYKLKLSETVKRFPMKIEMIKKAVWTHNQGVKLQLGGRDDASSVEGTTGHTAPKNVKVPSIDFSKFVAKLPEAFIVCSMDIEGSEYGVLWKMIKDGTIDRINVLDLEFHHRFMNDRDSNISRELLEELLPRTAVKLKVEL